MERATRTLLAREWTNLAWAGFFFAAFFVETGTEAMGPLARLLTGWPTYELAAVLVLPPLILAERPLRPLFLLGVSTWTLLILSLLTLALDDPLVFPMVAFYVWGRGRAQFGRVSDDRRFGEFVRVVVFLLPLLVLAVLMGFVFAGMFGTPIATSAEFHDRELISTLEFRDGILAAGGMYCLACVGLEVWLERGRVAQATATGPD